MADIEQKAAKTGTVILKCSCSSEYQDKRYGKGMRVHNIGKEGRACTVCGNRKK